MILDDEFVLRDDLSENSKYANLYELRNLYKFNNIIINDHLINVIQKIVNNNLKIVNCDLNINFPNFQEIPKGEILYGKFSYITIINNKIIIRFSERPADWYFYIQYDESEDAIQFIYNFGLQPTYKYSSDDIGDIKYNNLIRCHNYINNYYNLIPDSGSRYINRGYFFKF